MTIIDAMAMVKLNVLHLHLNENKFRVESESSSAESARNCLECGYYSYEDIGRIVQFNARGVRITPSLSCLHTRF